MTEEDTINALKKWTYTDAIAFLEELRNLQKYKSTELTWSEMKLKIKQVTGWDTTELYELRKREIEVKGLFR